MKTSEIKPEARDEILTNGHELLNRYFMSAFDIADPLEHDWSGKYGWVQRGSNIDHLRFIQNQSYKFYFGLYKIEEYSIGVGAHAGGMYHFYNHDFNPVLLRKAQFSLVLLNPDEIRNIDQDGLESIIQKKQEKFWIDGHNYDIPEFTDIKIQWAKDVDRSDNATHENDVDRVYIFNNCSDPTFSVQRYLLNLLLSVHPNEAGIAKEIVNAPDKNSKTINYFNKVYSYDYFDQSNSIEIYT